MDTEVLVTMCDANAQVGSVQSSWIGPMRPEKENQNGRQLHQMLEEFDQIASNTFLREHRPESITWRFPGNGLRRWWLLAHMTKLSWALETSRTTKWSMPR